MKKGKDILQGLVAAGKPVRLPDSAVPQARPSGAVKAMSLGLDRLSAEAAQAKTLREELARSEMTLELDPALFDASIVSDRIPFSEDARFRELQAAIAENGQLIPIIARLHPTSPGRFQIAAGHRRWRVAQELGVPLKAIIRKLSDAELVVLQGQENGPREDLSFIERARFALQMEARGFDRDTLSSALSVDKPEVSRLLTVAQTLGEQLIVAIGPAPKVGRPRWLQLVKGLEQPESRRNVEQFLSTDSFKSADSDRRFALVLEQAKPPKAPAKRRLANSNKLARLQSKDGQTHLISENPQFSEFLQRRFPQLLEEFKTSPEAADDNARKGQQTEK